MLITETKFASKKGELKFPRKKTFHNSIHNSQSNNNVVTNTNVNNENHVNVMLPPVLTP